MQFLPTLSRDSVSWRFPLADASSVTLGEALLEDDAARRSQLYATVLSADPSCALWTVCRADQHDGSELKSLLAAADWLGHCALQVFSSPSPPPSVEDPDEAQRQLWGELVAAAVSGAPADRENPRYLELLLRGAVGWLSTTGSPMSLEDVAAGKSCFPRWLAASLQTVPATSDEIEPSSLTRGQQARQRWLSEVDGGRTGFFSLVARLIRLRRLETDFSAALEEEKLESLRQFAYGAGHEINNPLANISTRAQTLLQDEHDPERQRKLATINSQAFRAHEMIADLMLFARPPQPAPESIDLVNLVDQVLEELSPQAIVQGTELMRGESDTTLQISVDPVHLNVAIRAVCANSLEAVGQGGRIELEVRAAVAVPSSGSNGRWAEIVVRDSGPGVSPDVRRHLFDPFYSGREAGRGLGFGLPKCWRIVTQHGGSLDVDSEVGRGATFTIRLPM